jgi:hypothetical protein
MSHNTHTTRRKSGMRSHKKDVVVCPPVFPLISPKLKENIIVRLAKTLEYVNNWTCMMKPIHEDTGVYITPNGSLKFAVESKDTSSVLRYLLVLLTSIHSSCMAMNTQKYRALTEENSHAEVDVFEVSWAIQRYMINEYRRGNVCFDKHSLQTNTSKLLIMIRNSITRIALTPENAKYAFTVVATIITI